MGHSTPVQQSRIHRRRQPLRDERALKAIGQHPLILSSPSENPYVADIGSMARGLTHASQRDRHYYDRSLRLKHEDLLERYRRLAFETSFGPHYGLRHMIKQVAKERVDLPRKRYWCTKTFPSERGAEGLSALYPHARFVWIMRNGFSVVHSRTKFPEFRDLPFAEHCHHWANSIKRFSYLRTSPVATVVHQEDLTDNPEGVFRSIFQVIGIPYDPASTQYAPLIRH